MIPLYVGMDLGTTSVLVNVKGRGIVINEPAVVALDRNANRVVAVGSQALEMLGKTPSHIVAVRPMRDGVIADFDVVEALVRYFLRQVSRFCRIMLTVSVPANVSPVQRRAVREVALAAGASKVWTVEEPLAAALGAQIDMRNPEGVLVVDIGGGTTDIAILSMGMVVVTKSIKVAGSRIDDAIERMLRQEYKLIVVERTAESLKINLGTAIPLAEGNEMEIRGCDVVNGLPRSQVVNSNKLQEAIDRPLQEIAKAIAEVLAQAPPELAGDIAQRGLFLTGGGALLTGLDAYLGNKLGIPVHIVDSPLTCVALGTVLVNTSKLE